jgi:hypothetical protein
VNALASTANGMDPQALTVFLVLELCTLGITVGIPCAAAGFDNSFFLSHEFSYGVMDATPVLEYRRDKLL